MLRLKNVVGFWRLRGDGHDESGNGLHMSSVSNIAWVEDRGVTTPYFNGTNSSMATATGAKADLSGKSFTFACWVKAELGTTGKAGNIGGRNTSVDGAARSWDVPFVHGGDRYFQMSSANVINTTAWSLGDWHHFAWINDAGANKRQEYLDGVLQEVEGTYSDMTGGPDYLNYLGGSTGGNNWWFQGWMQDVVYVAVALSANQISRLYRREKPYA